MTNLNSFEDMPVWQEALDLADDIYRLTESLPKKEDYGLTSQLRRAALSVSANIAEGFGRRQPKDKSKFYYTSRGSLAETKNGLIYGERVGYFADDQIKPIFTRIDDIWKQLNCLAKSIRVSKGTRD